MHSTIEGKLTGKGRRFGIVASRFNEFITHRLIDGALDCLTRHDVDSGKIEILWVPGSYEIPPVAKKAVETGNYDAVICLGAVIRGGTPHFDYIAAEVSKGIAQIALQSGIPVIFGVITADTVDQAIERAGTKMGNKGWDAALAGLEMVDLYGQIKKA
jgi:6,7-dimethyl-8-ribityllumazine synthase